jgi:hypothetical protein
MDADPGFWAALGVIDSQCGYALSPPNPGELLLEISVSDVGEEVEGLLNRPITRVQEVVKSLR